VGTQKAALGLAVEDPDTDAEEVPVGLTEGAGEALGEAEGLELGDGEAEHPVTVTGLRRTMASSAGTRPRAWSPIAPLPPNTVSQVPTGVYPVHGPQLDSRQVRDSLVMEPVL
jgi:hypothetical protein